MRSFVLWYESRIEDKSEEKDKNRVELELHINLWKKNESETFVFDFGLMVSEIDLVKNIYFYLPFKGTKFSDLGHIISKNANLIEGIFNENCEISTFHPKRIKVNCKNKKEKFIIYSLSDEDIEKKVYSKGELLTINVENILSLSEKRENQNIDEVKKYYFRFRCEIGRDKTSLIEKSDSNGNLFLDLFSRTETIDFRINDVRSCSEKVMEEYYRNKRFTITKIHYLLLRNCNDEFIYYDGQINSRVLEKELWSHYIDDIPEDIIAYHIKEKDTEGIKSFSRLVRFRYEKTSWIRIIFILIISSCIPEIIKGIFKIFSYFYDNI